MDSTFVTRPVNSPCQSYSPFLTAIDLPVLACEPKVHVPVLVPRSAKSMRHV